MKAPVTAYVSSKDRYFTTLPSCILSIIHQTIKPERLIIFMDGEHIDVRNNDLYVGLFKILELLEIKWEVVFSPRKGQVANHQLAIDMSTTKWIWRHDDDTFAEPTVLEKLMACDGEKVGAIAGLVINPTGPIDMLPQGLTPTLNNLGANVQWFTHPTQDPMEAEHLYSTFLFKKEAASHGYCKDLSPVGHREETIFTYEMFKNGWKLIVTPKAITWHVKQGQGGIRSFQSNPEHWEHDEKIFQNKLKEWNRVVDKKTDVKLAILDSGMGDHLVFKTILPELKEKYNNQQIIVGCCYPEIFEDESGLKLISIKESREICSRTNRNFEDYNVYRFCANRNWKRSLKDAFRKLYLEVLQ